MGSKTKPGSKRVLFVCWGNICRSPMAEGLAKKMLGDPWVIESAGIEPADTKAADDAINAMEEMGIDIRGHRPRKVTPKRLDRFDVIIAMDFRIGHIIKSLLPEGDHQVLVWEVDDPYGGKREDYRHCAETIKDQLLDWMSKEISGKEDG